MLSAAEIIDEGNKPSHLPDHGGLKYFKVEENSDEQKQTVKHALQQYSEALKEQRVCRKMNLSVAVWQAGENVALVTTIKGGTLQKFGYQSRSGKFLLPEEALFLLEQGILELSYEGMQLSVQEAYMLLLPALPSFEFYQVFAHLCRLGFVVTRCKKSETLEATPSEPLKTTDETASTLLSSTDDDVNVNEDIPECLSTGYMKYLWRGGAEKPLVRPSEAKNTASVLSKLRLPTLAHLKDCDQSNDSSAEDSKFSIDFDVYVTKESKKKKQNPTQPHFRVVVCRYADPPPSMFDLARLSKESDGVHLKMGVVNQGTVTFYGMFSVDLPTLITQP